MSTFIRSALLALVMVTGVSTLAMAAPHKSGGHSSHSEQRTPAFPPADYWDRFKI